MNDLLTQLRDYGRQIGSDPMLSAEALPTVDVGSRPPRPRFGRGLAWAVSAFAVVLILGGLYVAFSGDDGQVVDQTTVPTATTTQATPTTEAEVVHGWPHTTRNPAGLYSWDGNACAGGSCVFGFIHNGYGSGDVDIHIKPVAQRPINDESATAVTVAGHDGIYLASETDLWDEKWYVDIEGTRFEITLIAEPGTSQADLDEAHAIIDSIRTEPSDNSRGVRLVFTLTTDDWDSG